MAGSIIGASRANRGWALVPLASVGENSFDEARMEPKVMMLNQLTDQGLDGGDVPGRFGAK
jgi:hypothetical protein